MVDSTITTCIVISCLSICIMICSAQWIKVEDPLLPRADKQMIPAFYNDSIFIIGGSLYGTQMTEYMISDNIMFDRGSEIISSGYIWGPGQYHTQFGNIVRLQPPEYTEIIVYNLEEKHFVNNVDSIVIPDGVKYGSGHCLTSNEQYLLIIEGWNVFQTVQVLILDNNTWFNGTSLTEGKLDHGCIATADFVYVFGYTVSVDKIAINDIQEGSWTHIGSLTESLSSIVELHVYANSSFFFVLVMLWC